MSWEDDLVPLEEIGKVFGVRREQIRRTQDGALRRLRSARNAKLLRPFVQPDNPDYHGMAEGCKHTRPYYSPDERGTRSCLRLNKATGMLEFWT